MQSKIYVSEATPRGLQTSSMCEKPLPADSKRLPWLKHPAVKIRALWNLTVDHDLHARVYARNAFCSCALDGNAVVLIILPAGAIYTEESYLHIDGNTVFVHNSAEGEPRRSRSV